MSAVADRVRIDMAEHRAYADASLPNGEVSREWLRTLVDLYDTTSLVPDFAAQYRLVPLAEQLHFETLGISNPRRIIEHPAFAEIKRLGEAAIPYVIRRLDHEPWVWLVGLPTLVGSSPVRPEHRGRTTDMVSDWKQWAAEHGYLDFA